MNMSKTILVGYTHSIPHYTGQVEGLDITHILTKVIVKMSQS